MFIENRFISFFQLLGTGPVIMPNISLKYPAVTVVLREQLTVQTADGLSPRRVGFGIFHRYLYSLHELVDGGDMVG